MCQCYQIGGPFIAEDPDCPAHGVNGYRARIERAEAAFDRWFETTGRASRTIPSSPTELRAAMREAWVAALAEIED